jgi:hypothetical protein
VAGVVFAWLAMLAVVVNAAVYISMRLRGTLHSDTARAPKLNRKMSVLQKFTQYKTAYLNPKTVVQ